MSTSYSILRDIENTLRPLIEADKGKLDVADDLDDALKQLAQSPKGWRVVLLWDGHLSHGEARHGMTRAGLTTFLQMDKGMSIKPSVHRPAASGRAAFLTRLETLSQWCRALRWPADTPEYESGIDCAGLVLEDSSWVSAAKDKTLAHGLSWSLQHALESSPQVIEITKS